MSERKQEEIDAMFKATNLPKLLIEDIPKINKISVVLDNTTQGMNALTTASEIAKKFQAKLDIIVSEDFFEAFKVLIDSTNDKLNQLSVKAKTLLDEKGIHADIQTVIGGRIDKVIEVFGDEITDEMKLGNQLISKFLDLDADLLVLGVPLFQSREDPESELLGSYVTKILRARDIRANVVLVSEQSTPLGGNLIAFVEVNQQPRSIIALTKRALSLSNSDTKMKLVGIIEDKFIETVARIDSEDETSLPIQETTEKLKQKFSDTLGGITLIEELPQTPIDKQVSTGKISEIVNLTLKNVTEGLVLVRSVAEIQDNLDPIAQQITRLVLAAGFPCLIVWD